MSSYYLPDQISYFSLVFNNVSLDDIFSWKKPMMKVFLRKMRGKLKLAQVLKAEQFIV